MSKKKFFGNIGAKGYYIALILCAVAIGISGYLYYQNTNKPNEDSQTVLSDSNTDKQDVAVVAPQGQTDPTQSEPQSTQPQKEPVKRVSPVSGQTVSPYSVDALCYNQTTRDWRTHNGVDIAAEAGTAVCAAADGTVYTVFEDQTMGTCVVIRHEDGYTTTYASLDPQVSVKTGDPVQAGQTIGSVGNSALLECAIGDHVHFSVSKSGNPVDPSVFLEQSE